MKYLKPFCAIFISVAIVVITIGTINSMSLRASEIYQIVSATTDELVLFDFETNTTEGWENSTKAGEKGISAVSVTSTQSYSGQHSLAMTTHLSYSNSITDFNQGAAFVMFPGNMNGRTIIARVKCPTGVPGDPNHRNGVQLFVKDQNFNIQLAEWKNIGTDIPVNQWTEINLTPGFTNPIGGYTDPGFDPTRIQIVGIKLGVGTNSQVSFSGTCFLDGIKVSRAPLIVPDSDHIFNFNNLTPEQQQDKPFGHGPYWGIDSGWGAGAWDEEDITVQNGMLVITATFTLTSESSRKGFVGVELLPSVDINNKTNRIVRAEVRFDPYIGPEQMIGSIFVYDRRDGCENKKDNPCDKWYVTRDIWAGGSVWNELIFNLNDASQFKTCQECLSFTDIATDSLKNILKVGIQFYAKEPYTGTIYLDNVTIGGEEKRNCKQCNEGFVVRSGSQFLLKGKPYRFVGSNVYYPFAKSHYMIDDVMETYRSNDIRVLRTWGFSDGKAPYADDGDGIPNGNEGSAFQPEEGLCYEPTFVNFDYVVKSAGEHGIRLIVPLVNYWSDQDKLIKHNGIITGTNSFGGMAQYLEWQGLLTSTDYITETDQVTGIITKTLKTSAKDQFYSNSQINAAYKNYVDCVVNRVNILTGIPYKTDPTILAWELANEPRSADTSGDTLYNWAVEMSAYIKSLDPNHLVALGDEGFLDEPEHPDPSDEYYNGSFGVDWRRNLGIADIDFGTVHLYPDHWNKDLVWATDWITNHITIAQQVGKPVVFEEFGICNPYEPIEDDCSHGFDRNDAYITWTNLFSASTSLFEQGADGDLVWMIAGKVNNINEDHVELNGDYYFPDFDGFTFWEPITDTMSVIKSHAAQMNTHPLNLICYRTYLPVISK